MLFRRNGHWDDGQRRSSSTVVLHGGEERLAEIKLMLFVVGGRCDDDQRRSSSTVVLHGGEERNFSLRGKKKGGRIAPSPATVLVSRVLYPLAWVATIYLCHALPQGSELPPAAIGSAGSRGTCVPPKGVASDRVYRASHVTAGSVSSYLAFPSLPLSRRFISVALSRRSPSADVIRYPSPMKPGLSSRYYLSA